MNIDLSTLINASILAFSIIGGCITLASGYGAAQFYYAVMRYELAEGISVNPVEFRGHLAYLVDRGVAIGFAHGVGAAATAVLATYLTTRS